MYSEYMEYAVKKTCELMAIDSPTGFTKKAVDFAKKEFESFGFTTTPTNKGGLVVHLGGDDKQNGIMLQAHVDTLGAMVAEIKPTGKIRLKALGGLQSNNCETENATIYTRSGKTYSATLQLHNPSTHVNGEFKDTIRTFNTTELVIDEDVKSKEDVKALGIRNGDFVAFDPRTRVTESGYIKSRFLDDKMCVGILMAFAKYIHDTGVSLLRDTYFHITVFEEVGHGGAASIPDNVTEVISVDMGCVGDGVECTEKEVSICVKDAGGPYHIDVVNGLIEAAEREDAKYELDVYNNYKSDVEMALTGGYDIRHGCIGPGVFASHGYERTHKDGVLNTFKVLKGYLVKK